MWSSVILDTVTRAVFQTVWVFSLYLLFAGHNAPGGGFVGGLVGGAALVLRYAGTGSEGVSSVLPLRPETLLGGGLLLAGGTGAASWLLGAPFLTGGKVELDVPVLGLVKATSALAFDMGVYLVVVGLVLMVLCTLGGEGDDR
ncbi:MAG: MnhB domain-containing protein [Egibacteraceae bacterium]